MWKRGISLIELGVVTLIISGMLFFAMPRVRDIIDRICGAEWSVIHATVLNTNVEVLRTLLGRGADPNGGSEPGDSTSLALAIHDDDQPKIALLTEYGAEVAWLESLPRR